MRSMKLNPLTAVITAILGTTGAAFADTAVLDENDPNRSKYPISTNPTDWQTDRHGTAEALTNIGEWAGKFNVLQFGIAPPPGASSFYQWEGYLTRTPSEVQAGNSYIGGSLWVNSTWQSGTATDYVRTGMWGSAMPEKTVADGKYVDSQAIFPIMSFTNQNGTGRLEVWDTTANPSTGWVDLTTETKDILRYDSWNSIDMRLLPEQDKVEYYLNGTKVYTWNYPRTATDEVANQFWAMYLKGRNNGVTTFSTHWADLVAGQLYSSGQPIGGDISGDVVISPGAADAGATVIADGTSVSGTLAAIGNPDTPSVIQLSGNATVGNVQGSNAALLSMSPQATTSVTGNMTLDSSTADLAGNLAIGGGLSAQNSSINLGTTADSTTSINGPALLDGSSATFAGSTHVGLNLNASNSTLDFSHNPDATTQIGGDVNLAGSTTSGGTVDSRIQVGGDVTVDNNSSMGGNWQIDGDLASAGQIKPGNSIGVVGVGRNLVLSPTSTYHVEVDAAGNSDRIDVGTTGGAGDGVAHLAGGVSVSSADGYNLGQRYLILTAEGGFAGTTFDNSKLTWDGPDYLFLAPGLQYDPTNVYLVVDRNGTPFATVAKTTNQAAAARGLESLALGNQAFAAVATSTDASHLPAAFDQLSGEIHASGKAALMEDSKHVRDTAIGRVREAFAMDQAKPDSAETLDGWVKIYGADGSTDASDGAAKLDRKSTGVLFGADTQVGEYGRIGVMGGVGKTDFDVNDRDSSGKSDNYSIGVYGGAQKDRLGVRAGVAHTWHEVETDRHVDFPGYSDKLSANYDAQTTQVFGEVGYKLGDGNASLEPFAGVAHVKQKTDGIKEKGGDAALHGKSDSLNTTFTTLGVRGASKFTVGNTEMTTEGSVGWKHAFGDIDTSSTMAFAGGDSFQVDGVPIAKDSAVVSVGLKAEVAKNATLGASISGEVGSDAEEQAVNLNFTYKY
ncbi:outer membrane autotransporter barrel domain protein [compost metagenome]